jgi:O-antigen/teichoic acid export membrane protein
MDNESANAANVGVVEEPGVSSRGLFSAIFQSSGAYSIAIILQRSTGFLLLPIMTRRLTTADYGLAGLLEQVSVVLGIVLGLQFVAAIGYFHFQCKTDEERRQVAGTGVFGSSALGLLICVICWPLAPLISRLVFGSEMATGYLRLSLAIMPGGFFLDGLFSWLRVVDKQRLYTLGNAAQRAGMIAGIVTFVGLLRLRVWGIQFSAALAAASAIACLGAAYFRTAKPLFSVRLFWRMAKFSASIGLSSLAIFFIHFGDRFFLVHYCSLSDVGIYSLSYKLGMLISTAYYAFSSYWSAQVYQIVKRPDSKLVVGRLFTYVMLGAAFCGLGIALWARPALKVIAAPSFQGAAAIAPLVVLAYCVRIAGDFWRCMFLAAGRPAYDAVCNWIGALTCLAGYIFLIPKYGIWGAAFTTLLGFLAIAFTAIPWAYSLQPCHFEGVRLLKIAAAAAVSIGLSLLLGGASLFQQIICASISLAVFPLALWTLRFPTSGEIEVGVAAADKAARAIGQFTAGARGRLGRG